MVAMHFFCLIIYGTFNPIPFILNLCEVNILKEEIFAKGIFSNPTFYF